MTQETLGQAAQGYQPETTLNAADLDYIDKDETLLEDEGKDQNGKPFKYRYVSREGKKYRVANPVLEKIKTIISIRPDAKRFKVTKTGSGISTKYDVNLIG